MVKTNVKKTEKSGKPTAHKKQSDAKVKIEKPKAKISEIDDLFAGKKQKQKAEKEANLAKEKADAKRAKDSRLKEDRSDISNMKKGQWRDDGRGGVFDCEGFTGRKEAGSGFKIYKAHLMNKKGFGQSKDCPFDCDCCYI
uniref:Uncharacterized protein n=1 Tax=Leptocylindrus danicus TaxID=163516 RepID=A0A7S2NSR5_9STRA|mmetsp:Transcript_10995/g.16602  ORF Transcript_10995/g.16602 Transcript_10995/m.16602 type:complete len:140 (+) Transcript_10995:13-432(+)